VRSMEEGMLSLVLGSHCRSRSHGKRYDRNQEGMGCQIVLKASVLVRLIGVEWRWAT